MQNMSKRNKILLIIATFMPFVFAAMLVALFVSFIVSMSVAMQPGHANPEPPPLFFVGLFGIEGLMILWGVGLFVLYLIHLLKTDRVRQDQKALWGVILFLGGIIAMVVYWFMYVWPEPKPTEIAPNAA
jgi:predicted membrane channel-forming protein YqfA (hemolysin III family)